MNVPEVAPSSTRSNLARQYKLLVWLAVMVPLLSFAFVFWDHQTDILKDTQEVVAQTAAHLSQHALNVFETHELVGERVNDHIRTMTWNEIAGSQELHAYLKEIQDSYAQIQAIWIADSSGIVRNASQVLPPTPVSVADRDYFLALRAADVGTFIGNAVKARVMKGGLNFNIARRRENASGAFDGVIVVTVFPNYFVEYWSRSTPSLDTAISLLRQDGAMLARAPRLDANSLTLNKNSPLLLAIQRNEQGEYRATSTVDGIERLYAYRKVGRFNAYIGYGIGVQAAMRDRRYELIMPAIFFAVAGLALVLMALLSLKHARREQRAHLQFQVTSRQLVDEAERRANIEEHLSSSERKLNQALRTRFITLVESAQDCIAETDRNGAILSINQGGTNLFGYAPEEIIGKPWSIIIAPGRMEEFKAAFEAATNGKTTQPLETEGIRRDGTHLEVSVTVSPIRDAGGSIEGASVIAHDITGRKRAEEDQRAAARYARSLIEASLDPLVTISAEGKITDVNQATEKVTGRNRSELIGTDFCDYFTEPDKARTGYQHVFAEGFVTDYPLAVRHRDGHVTDVLYNASVYRNEAGAVLGVFAAARDVTDRKRAEEALHRLNRELRAISSCNQILMRAEEEQTLLNDICRIVCDEAGYRMAWVGYPENDDAKTIRPVARAGVEDGYIEQAMLTWADTERGRGPAGTAVRSGQSACIQDFATESQAAPWRDIALQRGYRSLITLPLKDTSANTFGTLNIYSTEPNAFPPEEIRLLGELAGDLAFGIVTIRTRAERRQFELQKEQYLRFFRLSTEAMCIADPFGCFKQVNPAMTQLTGFFESELVSRPFLDFVHPDDRQRTADEMKLQVAVRPSMQFENRYVCKDGSVIFLSWTAYFDKDDGVTYASARDITERKRVEWELKRANRALHTLSACNEALVHAKNESELLDTICRLIVETGGYRMAWVGFPEQDPGKLVRPVAQYGHDEGFLKEAKYSWADTELGRSPTGTAIRTGSVQVNQSTLTNPALAPWRKAAFKRGYQSSIALPLKNSVGSLGVLTIDAAEPDAFNETEVTLLKELAADLTFGIETLRTRAERDRIAYEQQHHEEILRQSLEQSIQAIADTVEARDPYTAGHERRVAKLAEAIAREMGLAEERIHGIRLAASIHDLGKIQVPAEILSKPGKLTNIEFMLIQAHPEAGYDILKDIEYPWPIADIVRQHHEKLDGSGYPQGLKDGQILLESRILTVADVVEAMASHRPYRAALGIDNALKEIERGRGTAFDAAVVDACLKLFREERFAFQG